uniref:Ras family protein n=2 Tax=Wuchereria bancrofti TaxID=6293 RepID=A0A1I8ES21_WUCBA
MSENEQKKKTKEMSRNIMDSDQKAMGSTTASGKSISAGILMELDKAFQNKDLSGITEQQYQYYNRRCEDQKQQGHQRLQHQRINDFTGSLEDELSAAVIGTGDSETILQAVESVIEYPSAVYDSSPSSFNSPKSIIKIKQNFKVNDLRRRSQETTSELNLYKCSYFSDVKLSLESRPLADELRECGIINKEPPSMPRSDFLPDRIFKVVFVGDSAVGKTCFLRRFCHNRFKLLFNATIGVDFTVKTIRLCNRVVAIQLWDTAGQERFRSITEQYFRKADGVILMYDVTSERSFLNVRNWINSVKAGVDESCVMCLVGNKEFGMLFFETSAFNGFGVSDCMRAIAMKLQEREDQQMVDILKLHMSLQKKQKSWCCI